MTTLKQKYISFLNTNNTLDNKQSQLSNIEDIKNAICFIKGSQEIIIADKINLREVGVQTEYIIDFEFPSDVFITYIKPIFIFESADGLMGSNIYYNDNEIALVDLLSYNAYFYWQQIGPISRLILRITGYIYDPELGSSDGKYPCYGTLKLKVYNDNMWRELQNKRK